MPNMNNPSVVVIVLGSKPQKPVWELLRQVAVPEDPFQGLHLFPSQTLASPLMECTRQETLMLSGQTVDPVVLVGIESGVRHHMTSSGQAAGNDPRAYLLENLDLSRRVPT